MFLLSALSQDIWQQLKGRVFVDERHCSNEHLELFVFAMEQGLIRPNGGWTPRMAIQFCQQPALRMDTFARWIWLILHNPVAIAMLGQSTLEWKNRCMTLHSFPIPPADSPVAAGYTTKHALATLLAISDTQELLDALPGDLQQHPPHIPHIVNCIVSAMITYVQETDGLRQLAGGIVLATLKRGGLRLIMPPTLALFVPTATLTMEGILCIMCDSQWVSTHRSVNYYWVKSMVGYLLLLLRTPDVDMNVVIERLKQEFKHSSMVRGMLITQALEKDMFHPAPTELQTSQPVVRLQLQMVLLLLSLNTGNPMGCITEAMLWVAKHPLSVQMARAKDTRCTVRRALSASKPALRFLPLLQSEHVMRFMIRITRYLPVALDCILDEDVADWCVESMKMLCDDGRLVDVVVWRCMFQREAPAPVIQFLLDDARYRHREWQVPLRLHTGIRDPRRPPRLGGPLVRIVSSGPLEIADLGEVVLQIALQSVHDGMTMGAKWWRAATRNDPEGTGLPYAIRGWLLNQIRQFAQLVVDPTVQNTFPSHVEMELLKSLEGHPDTLTVANCLWFLLHFCSNNALAVGVSSWIRGHPCSWVSVIRDSVRQLGGSLPNVQHRCLASPEVFAAAATLVWVLWTMLSGGSQQSIGPPMGFLHRCDMAQIIASMSTFQRDLFITSSIEQKHYTLWAAIMLTDRSILNPWCTTLAEMYGFGPLSDIVTHLSRKEVLSVPSTVLEGIIASLRVLVQNSRRIQEYNKDDTSDLLELVKGLTQLFVKEYESMRAGWDIMILWHPGHMVDIPGLFMAALLQLIIHSPEWQCDTRVFVTFLTKWIHALGAGVAAEWKADLDMYDAELAALYSTTHGECKRTAGDLLSAMEAHSILRDDSLLAFAARVRSL